jgi:hypothetical protein
LLRNALQLIVPHEAALANASVTIPPVSAILFYVVLQHWPTTIGRLLVIRATFVHMDTFVADPDVTISAFAPRFAGPASRLSETVTFESEHLGIARRFEGTELRTSIQSFVRLVTRR